MSPRRLMGFLSRCLDASGRRCQWGMPERPSAAQVYLGTHVFGSNYDRAPVIDWAATRKVRESEGMLGNEIRSVQNLRGI